VLGPRSACSTRARKGIIHQVVKVTGRTALEHKPAPMLSPKGFHWTWLLSLEVLRGWRWRLSLRRDLGPCGLYGRACAPGSLDEPIPCAWGAGAALRLFYTLGTSGVGCSYKLLLQVLLGPCRSQYDFRPVVLLGLVRCNVLFCSVQVLLAITSLLHHSYPVGQFPMFRALILSGSSPTQ
jgi:hypothetical protein